MYNASLKCKLRTNTLQWRETSTFFGSNIVLDDSNELKIKWPKMIITINLNSRLAPNLISKQYLFLDKTYDTTEISHNLRHFLLFLSKK